MGSSSLEQWKTDQPPLGRTTARILRVVFSLEMIQSKKFLKGKGMVKELEGGEGGGLLGHTPSAGLMSFRLDCFQFICEHDMLVRGDT